MTTTMRPALEFDGVDDFIDCGENPAHELESAFTLEAWIYVDSWRDRAGILTKHLDANGDESGYALQLGARNNLRLALRAYDGDMVEAVEGAPDSLPIHAWHHVAGTFDGATMRVYVDGACVGEQVASGATLDWFPSTKLLIALTRDGDDERFFHGKIGQVRVWSRAKTADELRAGMDSRAEADAPGLVGSWPLDEGQGSEAGDESSTGQAGTIEGGPHWTDDEVPFPDAAHPRPGSSRAELLAELDLDFYRKGSINAEYVLLTNNTGEAVDLTGVTVVVPTAMRLVREAGTEVFAFPPGATLEAGQSFVIYAQRDGAYEFNTKLPLFYSIDGLDGYTDTVDVVYKGEVVKSRSKTTDEADTLPRDPAQGDTPTPPPEPDDLTKIEGIGPKTNALLHAAGVHSYADLAGTPINTLQVILDRAGRRFSLLDPGTWPEQAALAAAGKWSELAALQAELDGGIRP